MDHVMQVYTDKIAAKVAAQKEGLIKKALFRVTREEIDLVKEANKRFPRIAATRTSDGEETYWWNSGEPEPVRLITFTAPTIDFEGSNKITAVVHHY